MTRTRLILVSVVALVLAALVAVTLILPRLEHTPPIKEKAVGVWRETDTPERFKLSIGTSEGGYTVTYRRSFLVPNPADLAGETIEIWGENRQDIVWVATYDEDADTLTLTSPVGGQAYLFERL